MSTYLISISCICGIFLMGRSIDINIDIVGGDASERDGGTEERCLQVRRNRINVLVGSIIH